MILHKLAEEIRLTTGPEKSEKVAAWIEKYTFIEDVKVEDLTDKLEMLSLFGPQSAHLLKSFFNINFDDLPDC